MREPIRFSWRPDPATEIGGRFIAELLSVGAQRGDVIALSGDLGTGKTTWARAFLRALLGDDAADVPSPTFPLLQTYASPRVPIAHFDLYRLAGADGLAELGFDDALQTGVTLIEWPDRAGAQLPSNRLDVSFAETADPDVRQLTLTGIGSWAVRVQRLATIARFLVACGWSGRRIAYLQGDASARRYARLRRGQERAILMDAPRQEDGPIVRDGKPYSRIAHLAEDVRPFIAIDLALRRGSLSAPEILAHDASNGLLLLEDLGDRVFANEVMAGTDQALLWRAAVDVLVAMRSMPRNETLPLPDGSTHTLPRFDRAALEIEVGLLLDWYWPEIKMSPADAPVRSAFDAVWSPVIDRLMTLPAGWFLRDFHSPNLLWLPERAGLKRVGVIDFQDALAEHYAFDLVSLLQDARVDVPAELEAELFEHYCRSVAAREPDFDRAAFYSAYAAFGAQRNTRLVGLWVRLLRRDGKPGYLKHMARTWGYLERNLAAPGLKTLRAWYDHEIPLKARRRVIRP